MKLGVIVLSLLLYAILALGASVFGSYRYEPSGVQYVFLPYLAAPVCAIVAAGLLAAGRKVAAPLLVTLLPFTAVLILILPGIGMLLSVRNLEASRWALVAIGVTHAVALGGFLYRSRQHASDAPPA